MFFLFFFDFINVLLAFVIAGDSYISYIYVAYRRMSRSMYSTQSYINLTYFPLIHFGRT